MAFAWRGVSELLHRPIEWASEGVRLVSIYLSEKFPHSKERRRREDV